MILSGGSDEAVRKNCGVLAIMRIMLPVRLDRRRVDCQPMHVCQFRLAECVTQTQADIQKSGMLAPIVGHVGDGNFHVLPFVDTNNDEERQKAEEILERLAVRAIEMGGTCTGEHGIGQGKRKYMQKNMVLPSVSCRRLSKAIDPRGIMNPW